MRSNAKSQVVADSQPRRLSSASGTVSRQCPRQGCPRRSAGRRWRSGTAERQLTASRVIHAGAATRRGRDPGKRRRPCHCIHFVPARSRHEPGATSSTDVRRSADDIRLRISRDGGSHIERQFRLWSWVRLRGAVPRAKPQSASRANTPGERLREKCGSVFEAFVLRRWTGGSGRPW
jgi:hypothetical protein